MALTPLEIIALIFAVFALIKLVVVSVKKELWYRNVAKPIYTSKKVSAVVFSVLAIIIFYYLLQELSIAQIFATIAFSSLLIGLAFLSFADELTKLLDKAYRKKIRGWQTVYLLVWVVLLLWVLYEIFAVG